MRHLLLATIFWIPCLLHAADVTRQVQCRFLGFETAASDVEVLARSEEGAEIRCPLPVGGLSAPLACAAVNNRIDFYAPADGKPLAGVVIPQSASSVILVFVKPHPSAATPVWRVMVIEDTPAKFPDGGMFVANFNDRDIRFVVGEHRGLLRPGGSFGYAMPKEVDSFNMAPVVFQLQKGDQWRTVNESSLRFLPGMKYLVFAYQDPVTGRLRIQTCQDLAPAKVQP